MNDEFIVLFHSKNNENKLSQLLSSYQTQNLLIRTRMHSLIIAFIQSIPIVAIS